MFRSISLSHISKSNILMLCFLKSCSKYWPFRLSRKEKIPFNSLHEISYVLHARSPRYDPINTLDGLYKICGSPPVIVDNTPHSVYCHFIDSRVDSWSANLHAGFPLFNHLSYQISRTMFLVFYPRHTVGVQYIILT